MKYIYLFSMQVMFAILSANVFAHDDPVSPVPHTHSDNVDIQTMMIIAGCICAAVFLSILVQKIFVRVRSKK
jgi:hypothetical protein